MLDLELLKTLVCVVDEQSFSRAADRVHRTQSTVSQQILKLEDRLGQPLLLRDRTGKRVVPTESGERLSHYARRLLAMAQEAEEALACRRRLNLDHPCRPNFDQGAVARFSMPGCA